jgi:hypothetical protein
LPRFSQVLRRSYKEHHKNQRALRKEEAAAGDTGSNPHSDPNTLSNPRTS